ncbi:hypothetical protein [Aurantiacibacter zhengii]|uniref:Uncharacterized protein n=1 Tax=Aurantiacibacter zhengii TaxID=2307003 RepID=A0A418NTK9_9SPHN|nr:hypothetical protein [Aurantiacibacter zhengii]RIV87482.1 hypothetical protein D2V07_03790 [Aurantiacibacter zhengii]
MIGGIAIVGSRPPAGQHGSSESDWRVLVLVSAPPGKLEQFEFSPAEARSLAAELEEYAGVCERQHAALERHAAEQEASR